MTPRRPTPGALPRLPEEFPEGEGGAPVQPLQGVSLLRPVFAFAAIGVIMGNTLRRPLRGSWDETDLAWSLLFAVLAGSLALPYHLWQRRSRQESHAHLAVIRGDTLFVFPHPHQEQRVPLLGVTRLVQGASSGDGTHLTTERELAMLDAEFTISLDAASTARVVDFVNPRLPEVPRPPAAGDGEPTEQEERA